MVDEETVVIRVLGFQVEGLGVDIRVDRCPHVHWGAPSFQLTLFRITIVIVGELDGI
jgi:hypothetical protein